MKELSVGKIICIVLVTGFILALLDNNEKKSGTDSILNDSSHKDVIEERNKQFSSENNEDVIMVNGKKIGKIDPSEEQNPDIDTHCRDDIKINDLINSISNQNIYVCYKSISKDGITTRYPSGKKYPVTMRFYRDCAAPVIEGAPGLEVEYMRENLRQNNLLDEPLNGVENVSPTERYYLLGINSHKEIVYYWGYKRDWRKTDNLLFVTTDFKMYKTYNPQTGTVDFFRSIY